MKMNYNDQVLRMLERAEDLKIEGRNKEAIKQLHELILEDPNCVEAYEELGDNFLSLKQYEKSKKALTQALKVNPKSSNAHYLLGFLFSAKEDWNLSVEELTKADSFAPNHPEILRCLGWAVFNKNRQAQGISILERSRTLSPHDPNILCDLGVCYMNSGQFQKAKNTFQLALKSDPNSQQAKECLGVLQTLEEEKNNQSPLS